MTPFQNLRGPGGFFPAVVLDYISEMTLSAEFTHYALSAVVCKPGSVSQHHVNANDTLEAE